MVTMKMRDSQETRMWAHQASQVTRQRKADGDVMKRHLTNAHLLKRARTCTIRKQSGFPKSHHRSEVAFIVAASRS